MKEQFNKIMLTVFFMFILADWNPYWVGILAAAFTAIFFFFSKAGQKVLM